MTRARAKDNNFVNPNILGITNLMFHDKIQSDLTRKYDCAFFTACSGTELLIRIGSTVTGPIICALALPAFLLAAVGFAGYSLINLGYGDTGEASESAGLGAVCALLILPTLLSLALSPLVNLIDAIGSGINSLGNGHGFEPFEDNNEELSL